MYLELHGWWKTVWWLVQCCKWDQWNSCCWKWDIQWHIKSVCRNAPVPDVHCSRPGDLPSDRPSILDLTTNLNNRRFQRYLPPWPPPAGVHSEKHHKHRTSILILGFSTNGGREEGGKRVIRGGRQYNFSRWIYFYNPRWWSKVLRYTKAVWRNMMVVVTRLCHDSPNKEMLSQVTSVQSEIGNCKTAVTPTDVEHTHQYSFYYCFCLFIIFKRVSCCRSLPVFSPGCHCQT